MAGNIPLCICTTISSSIHLLMDIQVASMSQLCKQYCSEHWGTCAFFNFRFLRIHAQKWYCWVTWQIYSQFFKESPNRLPQWLYWFTFPPWLLMFLNKYFILELAFSSFNFRTSIAFSSDLTYCFSSFFFSPFFPSPFQ